MSPLLPFNFYELITSLISSAIEFNSITIGAWPGEVSLMQRTPVGKGQPISVPWLSSESGKADEIGNTNPYA